MNTVSRDIGMVFLGTGAILALPLTAMQFTGEVQWDASDFALMGALIAVLGLLLVAVTHLIKRRLHRAIAGAALVLVLMLSWVELAVGVFGSPFAGS